MPGSAGGSGSRRQSCRHGPTGNRVAGGNHDTVRKGIRLRPSHVFRSRSITVRCEKPSGAFSEPGSSPNTASTSAITSSASGPTSWRRGYPTSSSQISSPACILLDGGQIGYFTYVGPRQSMTACNADEFITVLPAGTRLRRARDSETHARCETSSGRDGTSHPPWTGISIPRQAEWPDPADRLAAHRPETSRRAQQRGPGRPDGGGRHARPEELALAVAVLNYAAGRYGSAVDLNRPHALSSAADEEAFRLFLNGISGRDILFIHRANPSIRAPARRAFIRKAGLVVYCGTMLDETASLADWVLPANSDLESWGDYEPYPGVYCLMQPTMRPIMPTREAAISFSPGRRGRRALNRSPGRQNRRPPATGSRWSAGRR